MNNVDYDKKKFTKDAYGNLIPKKRIPAESRYGREKDAKRK